MNSLPFISHHLFVAAVGNERRAPERSTRRPKGFARPDDGLGAAAVEAMPALRAMPERTIRVASLRLSQAQF
jgi:hypothetical protein